MNLFIEILNDFGTAWLLPTAVMLLLQSIPLVLGIYALDRLLRHRVHPAFLHALWLIVLLKFFVPPIGVVPYSLAERMTTFLNSDSSFVETLVLRTEVAADSSEGGQLLTPAAPSPDSHAAAPHSANNSLSWPGILMLLWIGGATACAGIALTQRCRLRRLIRKSQPDSKEERVRWTPDTGPCIAGLLRPTILLPDRLRSLDAAQLKLVLMHERLHQRHGDLWVRALQTLAQVLFFYHPLLWLVHRRLNVLRELVVDETVLRRGDSGTPASYSHLLVNLAECAQPRGPLVPVGMASGDLRNRIQACLSRKPRVSPSPARRRLAIALLLTLAYLLLPSGFDSRASSADEAFATETIKATAHRDLTPQSAVDAGNPIDKPFPDSKNSSDHWNTHIQINTKLIEAPVDIDVDLEAQDFVALSKQPGVDLLTAPRITVLPHQEGQIEMGQQVPFQFPGDDEITMLPVGIEIALLATPPDHVSPTTSFEKSKESPVTLQVDLTVNGIAGYVDEEGAPDDSGIPVPHQSHLTAKVVLEPGQQHGMAAFLREDIVEIEDKIPVLGDLPFLGTLFRTVSEKTEQRQSYLFLQFEWVDGTKSTTQTTD
jgi:beta-lactamase regulating signal transducer with metallopeptidase domain